jgi:hypothetical protein
LLVSHDEPPDGEQPLPAERAAEPVAQIPEETPAEITAPLPPVVQAPPQSGRIHQQKHRTVGLPLLDLLAPEQIKPAQPSVQQPVFQPSPVADQPQYGMPYPDESLYSAEPPYTLAPPYPEEPPIGGPRRWGRSGVKVVAAAGVGVLLLAVLGIWALSSSTSSGRQGQSSGQSTSSPASTPQQVAGGYQFTQHAARSDTDCAANAYGKVAEFFRATPCTMLDRALYSATVDGRLVIASVSIVRMPTEQAATNLRKLADSSGTGNVNDLLRAGVRVPGGPDSFTDAGYASTRDGASVVIAEADFADRAARDEKLLEQISQAALQLRK